MEKLYQNRDWLYSQYYDNKLTMKEMGDFCEISMQTIYNWMKRFGFQRRSKGLAQHLSKANHCKLSKEAIEWINGELLGDGSLTSFNVWSARFDYTSKYKEYIEYIANTLLIVGIEKIGRIRKRKNEKQNSIAYYYSSKLYPELKELKNKWYKNGKKTIPNDLELTPLICRQWYIGDGCLDNKRKKSIIRLCTCGFNPQDVKLLCEKLNKLGFKAKRQPHDNSIALSVYSTENFLNYIGQCPVQCYQYKWEV